jgi:hypothetical protein
METQEVKEILTHKQVITKLSNITKITVISSLTFCLFLSAFLGLQYKNAKTRVLVIDQKGDLHYATDMDYNSDESRTVEAKAHVIEYYKLIYEQNEENYLTNMQKASFLAGNCFKSILNEYNSNKLLLKFQEQNMYTRIDVDSVKISIKEMRGLIFGKQSFVYPAGTIHRFMHCNFKLLNFPRSLNNSHGFKVEDWTVFNNNEYIINTN